MAEKGGQTHGRAEGTGPVGDVASRARAFKVPTGSACGWPGGFSQNSVVISVRMIYVLGIRSCLLAQIVGLRNGGAGEKSR